ncbi:subclass B3 metallo-beta-lactamase [Aurantiacibacter xanthus]|uniref:Subclass B3 metallo-beta-lactamase n=2 Tax=Aurantiacibacter xanthus TaxID=1784712 RepID=A0A3A1P4I0_9SPHN|nr:subclass B3 metallo-beta-lactamase [Aurantiacibacter xanthus]
MLVGIASTLSLSACAAASEPATDPAQTSRIDAAFPPSAWPQACEDWDEWDKPGPPFALASSDSFYVGTCGIAAILIDSGEGLILIDSGTDAGADVVLANIAALGFDPADVKLILTSHEHFDHIGGVAKIQQATGAELVTSQAAAEVFTSGEVSPEDPQFGTIDGVKPARVDRIVGNGDVVELGNKRLVATATPGHTHGALSWSWQGCDEDGKCRTIVYADSLSPVSSDSYRFSDHPDYLAAYREAIAREAALDCDVLVTPHPSASEMRDKLLAGGIASGMNCAQYAASITERLDARLAEEHRP